MRRSTAKPPPPPPTAPATAFTLQGRAAPGLTRSAGWIGRRARPVLHRAADRPAGARRAAMGSLLLLLAGLSSAAGYQIVERRQRPPRYFMGASPLLIFTIQFVLVQIVTVMLVALGVFGPDVTPTFLFIAAIVQLAGYVCLSSGYSASGPGAFNWAGLGIAPIVCRTGAQRLRFWRGRDAGRRHPRLSLGALLSTLLGSGPPEIVPPPGTVVETVMIILAVCVFVPIGEELLYRGYNLSAWWRDLGARSAILRSGLFFGLVHVLNVNVDPNVQDAALAGIKQATDRIPGDSSGRSCAGLAVCSPWLVSTDFRTRGLQLPGCSWPAADVRSAPAGFPRNLRRSRG